MNKFLILWVALAVLLCGVGCAAKKVAIKKGVDIEQKDVVVVDSTETKTIEVIKTEKIVEGDTIVAKIPAADIKKPAGVVIENDAQVITINYDHVGDSLIIKGVQKAKKELQEIRREILEKKNITTKENSFKEKTTYEETPLPQKKGWSGVEWGAFWLVVAGVVFVGWKFRSGIFGFIKKLF